MVANPSRPALTPASLGWIAFAVWLIAVAVLLLTTDEVGRRFGDSDDAMRLQQVRDLLHGQPWYDLVQHRLDPPQGVLIHWSRLIDLPLALGILLLSPGFGDSTAETIVQSLWPLVPLLPALIATGWIAARLAGSHAAVIAIIYGAIACGLTGQFTPGRIDHHNVQLAATLVLFACIFGRGRAAAILGGITSALMLAVGMETLPYSVLGGVVVVLRYVAADDTAFMRDFLRSLAVAALALFMLTVAPARWSDGACDMISPVYVAPITVLALILDAGSRLRMTTWTARLALALGVAAVAIGVAGWWNPTCLKGPYAAVDSRLFAVWMNRVAEARSARDVFLETPDVLFAVLAVPLATLILGALALIGMRRRGVPPESALAALLGLVAIAFAIALWQVRASSFATVFAVPALAVLIVRMTDEGAAAVRSPLLLCVVCLCLNPFTLPLMGIGAAQAIESRWMLIVNPPPRSDHCVSTSDFASLAALPPGRVAASVDLGAFILATTPHSVLAAPYHRDRDGILDAIALLSGSDDIARDIIQRRHIDYVVSCPPRETQAGIDGGADGLEARLARGERPAWLESLTSNPAARVKIYRVKPTP